MSQSDKEDKKLAKKSKERDYHEEPPEYSADDFGEYSASTSKVVEAAQLLEESPGNKVMRLLNDQILVYLNGPQILPIRLVNSSWRDFATKFLNSRLDSQFTIWFKLSKYTNIHYLSTSLSQPFRTMEMKKLSTFTNLFKKSSQTLIPLIHFSFQDPGSLEVQDISEFFTNFGPQIKNLGLSLGDAVDTRTKVSTLADLLTKKAPNIEKLILRRLPKIWGKPYGCRPLWRKRLVSNSTLQFPQLNLKSLHLSPEINGNFKQIGELLKASPHLEHFTGWPMSFVPIILEAEKVYTIQDLRFSPGEVLRNPQEIEWYEMLAMANPKIKKLFLKPFSWASPCPHLTSRLVITLTQILESSVDTLEFLDMIIVDRQGTLQFPVNVRWPIMSQMTQLNIHCVPTFRRLSELTLDNSPLYPNGFIPQILPNITFLSLSFFRIGMHGFDIQHPSCIFYTNSLPLTKVIRLSLTDCPQEVAEKLKEICPNC